VRSGIRRLLDKGDGSKNPILSLTERLKSQGEPARTTGSAPTHPGMTREELDPVGGVEEDGWRWPGSSWTESRVETGVIGAITAQVGGIRARSALGAPGLASHNPPVVGSSPTRPT